MPLACNCNTDADCPINYNCLTTGGYCDNTSQLSEGSGVCTPVDSDPQPQYCDCPSPQCTAYCWAQMKVPDCGDGNSQYGQCEYNSEIFDGLYAEATGLCHCVEPSPNDFVSGCTNESALNFNPNAEVDNGSCQFGGQNILVKDAGNIFGYDRWKCRKDHQSLGRENWFGYSTVGDWTNHSARIECCQKTWGGGESQYGNITRNAPLDIQGWQGYSCMGSWNEGLEPEVHEDLPSGFGFLPPGPLDAAVRRIDEDYQARTYWFKGEDYWRTTGANQNVDSGYPKKITNGWGGQIFNDRDFDAVIYIPEGMIPNSNYYGTNSGVNDNTPRNYFFKGNEVVRYKPYAGVDEGYPRPFGGDSNYFGGLPANLDAGFYNPYDNKLYFFKGNEVYRTSWLQNGVDEGYPRLIQYEFPGIPSNIDVAFTFGVNNNLVHFFKDNYYWRFVWHEQGGDSGVSGAVMNGFPVLISGEDVDQIIYGCSDPDATNYNTMANAIHPNSLFGHCKYDDQVPNYEPLEIKTRLGWSPWWECMTMEQHDGQNMSTTWKMTWNGFKMINWDFLLDECSNVFGGYFEYKGIIKSPDGKVGYLHYPDDFPLPERLNYSNPNQQGQNVTGGIWDYNCDGNHNGAWLCWGGNRGWAKLIGQAESGDITDYANTPMGDTVVWSQFTNAVIGCMHPYATNYDNTANIHDESICSFYQTGCTEPNSPEYEFQAWIDDGSCSCYGGPEMLTQACVGCVDETALNYSPGAVLATNSCEYFNHFIETERKIFVTPEDTDLWVDISNAIAGQSNLAYLEKYKEDFTFSVEEQPGDGTVIITDSNSGVFRYSPPQDWFGETSFRIRINYDNPSTETEVDNVPDILHLINVIVEPVNDAPVMANVGPFELPEDSVQVFEGLTATDVEGDDLIWTVYGGGNNINASILFEDNAVEEDGDIQGPVNKLRIESKNGWAGTTSVTLRVTDNGEPMVAYDEQEVQITVTPVGDPPIIQPIANDTIMLIENTKQFNSFSKPPIQHEFAITIYDDDIAPLGDVTLAQETYTLNNFKFNWNTEFVQQIESIEVIQSTSTSGLTFDNNLKLHISNTLSSLNVRDFQSAQGILPNSIITINNERIKILTVNLNTGDVGLQRGVEGTSATSHSAFTNISIINPDEITPASCILRFGVVATKHVTGLHQNVMSLIVTDNFGISTTPYFMHIHAIPLNDKPTFFLDKPNRLNISQVRDVDSHWSGWNNYISPTYAGYSSDPNFNPSMTFRYDVTPPGANELDETAIEWRAKTHGEPKTYNDVWNQTEGESYFKGTEITYSDWSSVNDLGNYDEHQNQLYTTLEHSPPGRYTLSGWVAAVTPVTVDSDTNIFNVRFLTKSYPWTSTGITNIVSNVTNPTSGEIKLKEVLINSTQNNNAWRRFTMSFDWDDRWYQTMTSSYPMMLCEECTGDEALSCLTNIPSNKCVPHADYQDKIDACGWKNFKPHRISGQTDIFGGQLEVLTTSPEQRNHMKNMIWWDEGKNAWLGNGDEPEWLRLNINSVGGNGSEFKVKIFGLQLEKGSQATPLYQKDHRDNIVLPKGYVDKLEIIPAISKYSREGAESISWTQTGEHTEYTIQTDLPDKNIAYTTNTDTLGNIDNGIGNAGGDFFNWIDGSNSGEQYINYDEPTPTGDYTGVRFFGRNIAQTMPKHIGRSTQPMRIGKTYTFSFYAKLVDVPIGNQNQTVYPAMSYNINEGKTHGECVLVESEWTRCSVTKTYTQDESDNYGYSNRRIFITDSGTPTNPFYVWGVQLEEGEEVTEYQSNRGDALKVNYDFVGVEGCMNGIKVCDPIQDNITKQCEIECGANWKCIPNTSPDFEYDTEFWSSEFNWYHQYVDAQAPGKCFNISEMGYYTENE